MEKLLQISKEIDQDELLPLVESFSHVANETEDLAAVFDKLAIAKQKTKKLDNLVFISALTEAIAIFNDFSSLDAGIKKEMLQGCRDSTQFYLNRIIKESKEKNENSKLEWAKELENFISTCKGGKAGSTISSKSESKPPIQQEQQSNIPKQISVSVKEPKIELSGNVWYIENQTGNSEIEIITTEMQQRVVIINCSDSIIQIKGKCTAISVEQANKLGLVVHDVIVSTVELLNSTKTQVQLNSTCPTMTVDNSEGIQIFLGVGVADKFELLTCKSNEINLYRQSAKEEDYSNEIPVPEQFKSYFDESGDLKTVAVRHSGA